MKYYIIAGEASGDLHAANLIRELKKLEAHATFRCWGGDLMKAEGAQLTNRWLNDVGTRKRVCLRV